MRNRKGSLNLFSEQFLAFKFVRYNHETLIFRTENELKNCTQYG